MPKIALIKCEGCDGSRCGEESNYCDGHESVACLITDWTEISGEELLLLRRYHTDSRIIEQLPELGEVDSIRSAIAQALKLEKLETERRKRKEERALKTRVAGQEKKAKDKVKRMIRMREELDRLEKELKV